MRVRIGWSGETQDNVWQKVDVELDDQDLTRLLVENDLPDTIHYKMPTKVCFKLLQNEAESLLLHKLTGLGYPPGKAAARISVLVNENNEIVSAVKARLAAV